MLIKLSFLVSNPVKAGESCAGELSALICVEDLRLSTVRECFLQGFHAKFRLHRYGQPPSQNAACIPIHDGAEADVAVTIPPQPRKRIAAIRPKIADLTG
jgi:hypothetical protein